MIFTIICVLAVAYSLTKSVQLHAFSNIMAQEVHRVYKSDEWRSKEINIEKSYVNLMTAYPWNTDFKSMIVYEVR